MYLKWERKFQIVTSYFFPFSENQKPDEMEIIPPKTKIANPKSSEAKQINIVVEVKKTLELAEAYKKTIGAYSKIKVSSIL